VETAGLLWIDIGSVISSGAAASCESLRLRLDNKVKKTARFGVVLWMLALATSGCDRSEPPPSVVGPSPTPAPAPVPTPQPTPSGLNGLVQDTAFRPLNGATVEVLDGPLAGTSTTTGVNGQFLLTGDFDSTTRFSASLDGYVGATATWTQCATCSRPWLSFTLGVTTPPVSVAGDYTVTFIADPSCTGVPAELRTRSYPATMAARPTPPTTPAGTTFALTLNEGTFLPGYDNIGVGVAGNVVTMWFGGHGPGIVEQVASNTYLGFDGAIETVAKGSLQTVTTSFKGWVDYCALNAPMGEHYNCPLGQAVARLDCESANHQFILTRR
jgi:hypothetical protein